MNGKTIIRATDYQADDGSVVHSGVAFADAVIDGLNDGEQIVASLEELKGASSSYFNVFLRRVDEECGIKGFIDSVEMKFDSNVQKMMFERSIHSLSRGVRSTPNQDTASDSIEDSRKGFWRNLARLLLIR